MAAARFPVCPDCGARHDQVIDLFGPLPDCWDVRDSPNWRQVETISVAGGRL